MTFGSILEGLGTWTGIISTIITSSGVIFIAFKKIMIKLKPHLEILENLKKLTELVNVIHKEFKPNGGSSLKDSVNGLSRDLKVNMEMTKKIENRQNLIFNLSDVPHFETDSDGNCITVNEAYVRLMQRSKEDLLGGGWILGILEESRDEVLKEWSEAIAKKRNFEKTINILDKNNRRYLVKCIAVRQPDASGYLGYYSNIREI